jgi:hypothetical protein
VVNTHESIINKIDFGIGKVPFVYNTNRIVLGACGSDYQIPDGAFKESEPEFNFFLTMESYYLRFKACNTSLCNDNTFAASFYSENSTCERNQLVQQQDNVLSRQSIDNAPSVSKCFVCENCNTFDIGQIQNCSNNNNTLATNTKFTCQVTIKFNFF